jgi:hypothetical protein
MSSASKDLGRKKTVYSKHGVKDYIVVRVFDEEVDWFDFTVSETEPRKPDADGIIRSRNFPGLWLDPQSLLTINRKRIVEVLTLGMATPEHRAWVAELNARPEQTHS